MAVVMAVRERGAVGWWPHTLQAARAGAWAGSGLGGGSVVVCVSGGVRCMLESVQREWWHLVRENVNLGLSQKSLNEVRAACRDSV